MEQIKQGFRIAHRHPICKGFTVGRTLFASAAREWLLERLDDEGLIAQVADNYAELIECWLELRGAQTTAIRHRGERA